VRRALAAAVLAWQAAVSAQPIDAPNVVPVSPTLVTSGQPTAAALGRLGEQGFGAVIYLAPTTVSDAVRDEREIVERQGLAWINIPMRFDGPTDAEVEAFFDAMSRLAGRKVLVHCQLNLRGSTLTFLYRTIVRREPPEVAYEAVARVWSPQGPWKALIERQLQRHGIAFEPY